jgi:hypothetical protein
MFSKTRKHHSSSNSTRSSLKHAANSDSSVTLTKDPLSGITIPIPSPTNSNLNFPTTQITSQSKCTNSDIQYSRINYFLEHSNSSATSNNNNGGVRRRFLNLLRFTASRPSAAVRFSRQHSTSTTSNSCQISKQKHSSLTLSSPLHDNNSITSSSAIIKDELIESVVASANEHVINIIPSTTNSGDHSLETCLLCCHDYSSEQFEHLTLCSHSYCRTCLKSYLKLEITEGRVTLNCPQNDCPERIHPCDIYRILNNLPELISKYEQFMVRRVLQSIIDTRWCPSPDCGFAVIASGYASCPEIQCLRPGCNTSFCYHCKATWHPNKTCEDAAREKTSTKIRSGSFISLASAQQRDEIKQCPRCQASILKMDDGSCVRVFFLF